MKLMKMLLILSVLIWVMALGGCDIGDPAPTSTPTLPAVTLTATSTATSTPTTTATPGAYPVPSVTPEPYQ